MKIAPAIELITNYKSSGEVIDLGAGNGDNSIFLAKKGFKVTAVDADKPKIADLKAKANKLKLPISTKRADLPKLKLLKKYDIVVCTMVLHFLGKSKILKVVKNIKGHTKRDGLNVISVHTDKNAKRSRPHLFSKDELKSYYSDWRVLYYWEGLGKAFFSKSGKKVKKYRAEIIAQKH